MSLDEVDVLAGCPSRKMLLQVMDWQHTTLQTLLVQGSPFLMRP